MDPDTQIQVKNIAERADEDKVSRSDVIVVLGAGDLDGVLISAETVTSGDPGFTGPLGGVSLGLPVYHILEEEIRAVVPEDVYEENVGLMVMAIGQEKIDEIGQELKKLREKGSG